MGMFDTITLKPTLECNQCGQTITETQTKVFGNLLRIYKVGDVVETSDVKTGIIEEPLYCPACGNSSQRIFITIWHSLITGIYPTNELAESKLLSIDRADILNYLMEHQKAYLELLHRYTTFYRTVEGYQDFIQTKAKGEKWDPGIRFLSTRISEFVKAEDPLGAVLKAFVPLSNEDFEGEFSEE